jgi:hypothetical protein
MVNLNMENSPELKALIRKNASLFWYTKDSEKENLPLAVVTEFFFNYADEDNVKALFKLIGKQKLAAIFFEQLKTSVRVANNYNVLSRNFFSLYLAKYAHRNFK